MTAYIATPTQHIAVAAAVRGGPVTTRAGFTVAPMRPDQAAEVSALLRTIVERSEYCNEAARRAEVAKYGPRALAALIANDPDGVLVALAGRRVVGFCISRYDDGVIALEWIGVRQGWRARGVATALLAALERTVRRRGCHKICCDTHAANWRSQAVLLKAGYRKLCALDNHWYGQDFLLWEKRVA